MTEPELSTSRRQLLTLVCLAGLALLLMAVWMQWPSPPDPPQPLDKSTREEVLPKQYSELLTTARDAQLKTDWCGARETFQKLSEKISSDKSALAELRDELDRNLRMLATLGPARFAAPAHPTYCTTSIWTEPCDRSAVMSLLCLGCETVHADDSPVCTECRLPLNWIKSFHSFLDALRSAAIKTVKSSSAVVVPTLATVGPPIALSRQSPTTLGRSRKNTHALPDPTVEPLHLMIVSWRSDDAEPNSPSRFFLVDRGTVAGTFVNRRRIAAVELHAGDLLQVGPFAWSFSAVDGQLVPLAPIAGVGLQIAELHVTGRLGPKFELTIKPGQFVAIVGGSGAGKSTLVKVLAGQPGLIVAGRVDVLEANELRWDRAENSERFRDALGYVSQDSILHEALTARQVLTASARLRGEPHDAATIDFALLRAEIDRKQWDQPIRTLSGGQNKRVRTASELIGRPRLLLLDEPDSGLDGERRASLMRLLRALSWQGCMVVLVTHVVGDLEHLCDRVVEIRQGQVVRDNLAGGTKEATASIADKVAPPPTSPGTKRAGQFGILVGREWNLLRADWWSRLAVPSLVAALFALAVGVAVEPGHDHIPLLGFLSVVSVLWMSASASLLGIAGEREVFDHERQLFLSVPHYLLAKFLVTVAVAVFQTLLFFGALWLVRVIPPGRQSFHSPLWAIAFLSMTSMAGVSLGLCLSALAGRKKGTATFLLPLVMIAQLVFSVPVADHAVTNHDVEPAYTSFRWADEHVGSAAGISKLTISRPADMAFRAWANKPLNEQDEQAKSNATYAIWGIVTLMGWIIGFLALTFRLLQ